MTHLSRSDSDKMLSDMANEGSAGDYDDHDPEPYYEDDEMSGSGGDSDGGGKFFIKLLFVHFLIFLLSQTV